ncbi:MAG: CBS domain-containing protein [Deltaproteobacteria bacterium]|nr:CBS domain-containing protein [Deltaproteobacteria bacterium]
MAPTTPQTNFDLDPGDDLPQDDSYFDAIDRPRFSFDANLLKEPLTVVPTRPPLVFRADASVKTSMQAMQQRHRGCILVTQDGTLRSPLTGIFTERDILLRVIDSGRNPADVQLWEVMTPDPESLPFDAQLAWVLNRMAIGGYRHVPVVDANGWPTAVLAVRDVVEFLVESFPAEILNLPPDLGRKKGRARDGA